MRNTASDTSKQATDLPNVFPYEIKTDLTVIFLTFWCHEHIHSVALLLYELLAPRRLLRFRGLTNIGVHHALISFRSFDTNAFVKVLTLFPIEILVQKPNLVYFQDVFKNNCHEEYQNALRNNGDAFRMQRAKFKNTVFYSQFMDHLQNLRGNIIIKE